MTDRKTSKAIDTDAPTRQFVSYKVARTHARLARQGSRILKKVAGISRVEWWVIGSLRNDESARLSDIARMSDMDKGQLSRAIKGLIERGYVEARNAESDLRNQHLHLTRSGRALYDRAIPHMMRRQNYLMSLLTKEERQVLYSALDKLAKATDRTEFPESRDATAGSGPRSAAARSTTSR